MITVSVSDTDVLKPKFGILGVLNIQSLLVTCNHRQQRESEGF